MIINSLAVVIPTKYTNIVMDENSAYRFDELNETAFLTNFFQHLKLLLADSFEEYIFYIYANIDSNIVPKSLHRKSSKKKVLLFLSNQSYEINPALPGDYFAIFKCHLPVDVVQGKIFHFPLGYAASTPSLPVKKMEKRPIKVYFSGNLNKGRVALYKLLSGSRIPDILYTYLIKVIKRIPNLIRRDFSNAFPSSYLYFTTGFKEGLSPKEYTELLYDSQIVLCPKGFLRAETYRHFEAMRAGCVILSEPLPDSYLYRDSPIIQTNDWKEGLTYVEKLLADPDLLKKYHLQTLHWWETVCNEASTAKHVCQVLESLNAIEAQKG